MINKKINVPGMGIRLVIIIVMYLLGGENGVIIAFCGMISGDLLTVIDHLNKE